MTTGRPASALLTATSPAALPRVMIVDDSAVARAVLSRMVTGSGRFDVRAVASNAEAALAHLARERVEVILLDLEMPRTSGIDALPLLLRAGGHARVLVVSSAAAKGAAVTLQALALGAADTLVKPAEGFADAFRDELIARLTVLASPVSASSALARTASDLPGGGSMPGLLPRFDAIAIGASTGGIHAVASLLGVLPPRVTQPIFVTQHLPQSFSDFFAAQLAMWSRRPCALAVEHGRARPGSIVAAPGDAHLVAVALPDGTAATRLSREPAATGNLPAVDPMFTSLADVYGDRLLAVVLSGMGRDGLAGARHVRARGGTVVVQDRASSVVWGMPGMVADAGLAHAELAPDQLGALIARSART